jgi:hypothetical protein
MAVSSHAVAVLAVHDRQARTVTGDVT